jgi:deoxyadenosine/deoxycytidine kinase
MNTDTNNDAPWHRLEKESMFIGISGLIGAGNLRCDINFNIAGKTTLATELGKVMNLPVYYEVCS